MIYFKKIYFNYSDKSDLEAAFRKSAIKRGGFVQLELSTSDIGTDKLFFGYENKKGLYFIRIRTSLEHLLPKIVFTLPKDETTFYYSLRLGVIATILFFLLCVGLILSLSLVFKGDVPPGNFMVILIPFALFLFLTWLELAITSSKIKKAIIKQQNTLV